MISGFAMKRLKQTGSVEAFAAHFRNVNSRISVGSPIDTTTLATYFVNGLKGKVAKALATVTNLDTPVGINAQQAISLLQWFRRW